MEVFTVDISGFRTKFYVFVQLCTLSVCWCVTQVLEWDGVSLVDRSFEEVCAVMDRAGEVAELVVEHATDL
jgi:hypothetical protein